MCTKTYTTVRHRHNMSMLHNFSASSMAHVARRTMQHFSHRPFGDVSLHNTECVFSVYVCVWCTIFAAATEEAVTVTVCGYLCCATQHVTPDRQVWSTLYRPVLHLNELNYSALQAVNARPLAPYLRWIIACETFQRISHHRLVS